MPINIAINGYGRIGRMVLRALYEANRTNEFRIVGINTPSSNMSGDVHMTRYDSTHGKFPAEVAAEPGFLIVNGDRIKMSTHTKVEDLPWGDLNVDIVFECSGRVKSKLQGLAHIERGAKKILISAPGDDDIDAMVVYGVNHHILRAHHQVVSNASCTTNCLAPMVKPLHDALGIQSGLMNTVHSYTNDQCLLDSYHKDLRRARAAALSIIPTKTGAASAVGRVLPELKGKLDGYAVRVPTANVSLVDLTFIANRTTSVKEVNSILQDAAHGSLKGVLEYTEEPLVSIDFTHHPASSIIDAGQTKVIGNLVKVAAWYDNEWGFSHRMLDVAAAMMRAV